jgi:hypothetical protein
MADTDSPSGAPVEALLQERARFQQWLAKLDSAAGTAPAGVRQKVRSDYEGRLNAVTEQLKSHAAAIQEELDRHRASQRELDGRRVGAEEQLAEAQVRYAVGEYSDAEWGRLSADGNGVLESLQRELAGVGAEIARLAEVQGLITRPAPPSLREPEASPEPEPEASPEPAREPVAASSQPRPAPAIEMLPDPTPDFTAASGSPSAVEPAADMSAGPAPGAPRFVPKPAAEPTHTRPASRPAAAATKPGVPPLDELAFLKSVGGDKPAAAEDRKPRRSGETARPAEPVATSAQPSAKPGQASQAKTLKCGECGTLNRPTEWYCERCGAELAAL